VFLGVWFLATVFVMALGAYKHRAGGAYLMTARAAGAALNLNIGLLVLATARVVMGRIRRTPILRTLPVDHAIAFHQLVAYAVVVFAIVHTAAHLVRRRAQGVAIMDWLTADFFAMSGVVLAALLLLIFVTALPKVRTSGGFEWFRRTHLLYPVWLLLALSHGRHLWAWTLVPLGLFTLDRAARFVVKSRETEVVDLEPLVSGVTKVTLKKPDGFTHTAGDYLYLKIPRIAASEWHPFTISSAPENPVLTLHVRSLGDYTKRLHQLALERMASRSGESLGASIEGPFGTPSADILGSDIAVMVAGGIGVTPFASVLESIIMGSRQKKPQKVYFYWLNREGAAFAWFFGLLSQLEHRDTTRLVDIRVFMTRGQGRSTSMVLNLARSIRHGVGDRDHVTGLRTQTRMGAPNFRAELLEIVEHHPGRQVDVFFCGPPGLANSLKRDCASLGLPFRQEHF
jgi:predicted ferric reductase